MVVNLEVRFIGYQRPVLHCCNVKIPLPVVPEFGLFEDDVLKLRDPSRERLEEFKSLGEKYDTKIS